MHLTRLGNDYISMQDMTRLKTLVSGRRDIATTLLENAFVIQDKEVFVLLLENGANSNESWIKTKWGKVPLLMLIAEHEDRFWIESVLKHGADPNWHRSRNIYLLTFAINSHKPKNARLLMDYGADVNSGYKDQSQIDNAWSQWQHEITYELLIRGADFNRPSPIQKSIIGGMQFDFQPKANNLIGTSARKFGTYEYLEKILAWFEDHNLDWRNATHSDPTGKTKGTWTIPKLDPNRETTPEDLGER